MVHDLAVARAEFDVREILLAREIRRQHEAAILIVAITGDGVGAIERQNLVRRARLPSFRKLRRDRLVARIAFRRAGAYPVADAIDLGIGEPALVRKRSVSLLRLPRRHHVLRRHRRDLLRAARGILVGEQGERRNLAGAMAGGAVLVQNRRDVLVERRRRRDAGMHIRRAGRQHRPDDPRRAKRAGRPERPARRQRPLHARSPSNECLPRATAPACGSPPRHSAA